MIKNCFKCNKEKPLSEFYKHKEMSDGHVNKCKDCNKIDNKASNGKHKRVCVICKKDFKTTLTVVKRGGGDCCSRYCWNIHFKKIVKKDSESPNWKGDLVGKEALHNWVIKNLGRPMKCEHCSTTEKVKYEWSNISQKYKRDLSDWQRLCVPCHSKYDRAHPESKWNKKNYGNHRNN